MERLSQVPALLPLMIILLDRSVPLVLYCTACCQAIEIAAQCAPFLYTVVCNLLLQQTEIDRADRHAAHPRSVMTFAHPSTVRISRTCPVRYPADTTQSSYCRDTRE